MPWGETLTILTLSDSFTSYFYFISKHDIVAVTGNSIFIWSSLPISERETQGRAKWQG